MPAAASDKLKKLSKRWVGQIGAAGVTDDTTQTIPLASVTNLATDTAVVVTIDRVDVNGATTANLEETVVGVVSGSNLINCIRGAEGTAQSHNAGAVVEVLVTAKGYNDIIDHLLNEHNQDGTHKETTLDSIIAGTEAGGDTIYHNGSIWSRLAKGSDGQVLTLASGLPSWVSSGTADGWVADVNTWTYVSSTSLKVSGVDVTSQFVKGTKIKLTQTTAKYFIVKSSSFSTDTTVTVTGGSDYSLANAAITLPYYSYQVNPQAWPGYFNFTPSVTWNGTPPSTATTIAKFKVEGKQVFWYFKQSNTGAGTSNSQVAVDGIPIDTAGTSSEYNYAGSGYGSTNTAGSGIPTTNGRSIVYNSTSPTIYVFFDSSISAKAAWSSGSFEMA